MDNIKRDLCNLWVVLLVVIFDLRYRREWYFYDLAIGTFDLYARSSEGLGGFHASNRTTHASAVNRDNLHVVLAIEWLQSRKCLGDFHDFILPEAVFTKRWGLDSIMPFMRQEVYRA